MLKRNLELKDDLVIPSGYYPRRKWWYRMDERFEKRIPADKDLIGKSVRVDKVIVRTGYYDDYSCSVIEIHPLDILGIS